MSPGLEEAKRLPLPSRGFLLYQFFLLSTNPSAAFTCQSRDYYDGKQGCLTPSHPVPPRSTPATQEQALLRFLFLFLVEIISKTVAKMCILRFPPISSIVNIDLATHNMTHLTSSTFSSTLSNKSLYKYFCCFFFFNFFI